MNSPRREISSGEGSDESDHERRLGSTDDEGAEGASRTVNVYLAGVHATLTERGLSSLATG